MSVDNPVPDAPDSQDTQPQSTTSNPKKRRKTKPSTSSATLAQLTFKHPPWSYIHLQHLSPASPRGRLDNVTAHLHITAALTQFLGLHGSAIPIDILKISSQDVWIRVPADDRSALIAAVGGWTNAQSEGWRVKGWSHWNAGAMGPDAGREIFED